MMKRFVVLSALLVLPYCTHQAPGKPPPAKPPDSGKIDPVPLPLEDAGLAVKDAGVNVQDAGHRVKDDAGVHHRGDAGFIDHHHRDAGYHVKDAGIK